MATAASTFKIYIFYGFREKWKEKLSARFTRDLTSHKNISDAYQHNRLERIIRKFTEVAS
jgi:hypothetical protein